MYKEIKKFKLKIKLIIMKYYLKAKYYIYKLKCKINKQKEFLIFNAPMHGNIGDHAIIYAETKLLKKYNIEAYEIPTLYNNLCFDFLKERVPNTAIISITGGGFIGSQWMNEENLVMNVIDCYKKNKIIIFPQTFYFKNDEQGIKELEIAKNKLHLAENISIFVREKKSYEFVKDILQIENVQLIPDIVLYLDKFNFDMKRKNVLMCFRKDAEKCFEHEEQIVNFLNKINIAYYFTDTVIDKEIRYNRKKYIIDKLKEFSEYKLVITDRLHGMIFAYLTNTPCIVLSNYNYKVEGVYQWIKNKGNSIMYIKDFNEMYSAIETLIQLEPVEDSSNFDIEFEKLYKALEDC